jgi:pilus assembly protein CpaE
MLDRAIVTVLDLSDRAYVIVENVVPTVLGAVKLVEVLRSLGLSQERLRIVLNRYTTLPGSVNPADVANRLGHAVDHVIPFDKGIVIAANTGEPYVLRPRRFFGCGRQLRGLVDDIDSMTQTPPLNGEMSLPGNVPAGRRADSSPPFETDSKLSRTGNALVEPSEEDSP